MSAVPAMGVATGAPEEICTCRHTRADHPEVHVGEFASMKLPGCCDECWKISGRGCASFSPAH
jgi:hypothetical protein